MSSEFEYPVHFDLARPWYHGSPFELRTIRAGSTITQNRELARIFSHKPPLVAIDDDGSIKHTGTQPGYLYSIAEDIHPGDVKPHPRTTMRPGDEWLTTRELRVRFLCATQPVAEELLTEEDIAALYEKHKA
ncbi:MAG: hypothetical protein JXA33_28260 [Anaerolineae bacterium]|nr:hypothetical protein [Anaerolineae bacterium]